MSKREVALDTPHRTRRARAPVSKGQVATDTVHRARPAPTLLNKRQSGHGHCTKNTPRAYTIEQGPGGHGHRRQNKTRARASYQAPSAQRHCTQHTLVLQATSGHRHCTQEVFQTRLICFLYKSLNVCDSACIAPLQPLFATSALLWKKTISTFIHSFDSIFFWCPSYLDNLETVHLIF